MQVILYFVLLNFYNHVVELLGMLGKDRETAKRGMRIWYEEEFAQIEAQHKKELSINEAKYKGIG